MKRTAAQTARFETAQTRIAVAYEKLETAISVYNAAIENAAKAMQEARDAFESEREGTVEDVQAIGAELREAFDAKSERWQESDRGQSAATFVEAHEAFDIDTFDFEAEGAELEAPEDPSESMLEIPETSEE